MILFLKVNRNAPTDAGDDTLVICGSSVVTLGGNPPHLLVLPPMDIF